MTRIVVTRVLGALARYAPRPSPAPLGPGEAILQGSDLDCPHCTWTYNAAKLVNKECVKIE